MSLKDDLLRQKQEEDNKKAHAAEIKAEADRLAKEAADKKKEAEELSNAERLDRLQKDLDSGNIPKDYQELYDRFVERIKADVLAGKTSFEFKEDIEESYYKQKQSLRSGKRSELDIMNAYLTKRLADDGFYNAKFELINDVERFSTDEDYRRYDRDMADNKADAQRRYMNELDRWQTNYSYGNYYKPPEESSFKVRSATLHQSGKKDHFRVIVKGSLYATAKKSVSASIPKEGFARVLPLMLSLICAVACFVCPIVFYDSVEIYQKLGVVVSVFGGTAVGYLVGFLAGKILVALLYGIIAMFDPKVSFRSKVRVLLGTAVILIVLFAVAYFGYELILSL